MFHQVEGLLVDKGITMADLKGTLQLFAEKLFYPDTKTRFRPEATSHLQNQVQK